MRNLSGIIVLLILTCLLQGCISFGKPSPETEYYLLTAEAEVPANLGSAAEKQLLSVGPVLIPEFLDRPQIVTRSGSRAQIADQQRWAEPLDSSVLRVVSENLERLYPGWTAVDHLAPQAARADRSLRLDVRRLDGSPGEQAVIDILWQLTDHRSTSAPRSGRFQQILAQGGDSPEALAKTLSQGLVQLCREIPLR
jgi:uncharacterized protein